MRKRIEVLHEVLGLSRSPEELKSLLSEYDWDCEKPLVELRTSHVLNVLTRYLRGELNEQQIEDWANLIESREDVSLEGDSRDILESSIYELANPYLTQPLTKERALRLSQQME